MQRKYEARLSEKPKFIKFTPELEGYVIEKLVEKWGPEQVSKTLCKLEMVSHERIYQFIMKDKKSGGKVHKKLRRKKKYRNRCKPNR